MKTVYTKLLVILALSLSLITNTQAELSRMFKFTNPYGTNIKVIGEFHDAISIDQFKALLDKRIINGTEKDFSYLLELPSDLQDSILNPNRGLLDYLRCNNMQNSKKIDCDKEHTTLNLSFAFPELFQENRLLEVIKKIDEFFLKLGNYTDKDFMHGIPNAYRNTCIELMIYKEILLEAFHENNIYKILGTIDNFREKYKDAQNQTSVRFGLAVTPNGMQNRNQRMASNMNQCNEKNGAICIVGDLHIDAIRSILINQYKITAITKIESYEAVLQNNRQIFPKKDLDPESSSG